MKYKLLNNILMYNVTYDKKGFLYYYYFFKFLEEIE